LCIGKSAALGSWPMPGAHPGWRETCYSRRARTFPTIGIYRSFTAPPFHVKEPAPVSSLRWTIVEAGVIASARGPVHDNRSANRARVGGVLHLAWIAVK
jgi:hypothetical protein